MQDFDFERYKSLDMSKARPARQNPKIKRLQDNLGIAPPQDDLMSLFDSDVQETLKLHNSPQDRMRLNTMIRVLFATT
ncbi:Uncharacterised protein [Moraxella caprae]|uniref:Uncharacterized protein n=2 Tax=Moraxella TaxID=475 RepID=A0A378R0Q7_9GAMM|nr:hypothetical protein [Moraxella caprae]STZ08379.1 Uncharacterised protein [Moraxella caprae]